MENEYEVIIIGGGVIGTSLLYMLSEFTDIDNILLIEKNVIGNGSSGSWSNSQTLHVGDIETNYNTDKIIETRTASHLILKYTKQIRKNNSDALIKPVQKMVLGVGSEEVDEIIKR